MVASLERHSELKLDPATKTLLLDVSSVTIDRLLRPCQISNRRGQSTTKPGGPLKQQQLNIELNHFSGATLSEEVMSALMDILSGNQILNYVLITHNSNNRYPLATAGNR
jgi:hypothetical protein